MIPRKDLEKLANKLRSKQRSNGFVMSTRNIEADMKVKKACQSLMTSIIRDIEAILEKYPDEVEGTESHKNHSEGTISSPK